MLLVDANPLVLPKVVRGRYVDWLEEGVVEGWCGSASVTRRRCNRLAAAFVVAAGKRHGARQGGAERGWGDDGMGHERG